MDVTPTNSYRIISDAGATAVILMLTFILAISGTATHALIAYRQGDRRRANGRRRKLVGKPCRTATFAFPAASDSPRGESRDRGHHGDGPGANRRNLAGDHMVRVDADD